MKFQNALFIRVLKTVTILTNQKNE